MKRLIPFLLVLTCQFAKAQNVGIGNANPTLGKLEIYAPATGSQIVGSSGLNLPGLSHPTPLGFEYTPSIGFNLYYANGFKFMGPGYGAYMQYTPSSGIFRFTASSNKAQPGDATSFNATSIAIDSNGYLGIGTVAPKAKLHVNSSMIIGSSSTLPASGFLLNINGKMICEEVKVQMNENWPDYVFENDYKLLPLKELEEKVMADKHLPGIPSATEVNAASGIELGDMQKRMLEKVEELYRYLFELKKENEQLKKEITEIRTGNFAPQ
jgi:hypothetical protein